MKLVHKFNINKRKKLDSEERKRLLAPYETLLKLGLQEKHNVADIGCGTGLFTIPASEICGKNAIVYAIDISEEMLSEVKERSLKEGLKHIQTVKSDEYDFKLKENIVDFVLICTVLHEIDDKKRFLDEAKRICKSGGEIAVIEFNETQTIFGPPISHRIDRKQVKELLTDIGFQCVSYMDISEAFYAVTAINN
jgi:ubiquinone/menaquinone biosynthesis C-methylase UbiE